MHCNPYIIRCFCFTFTKQFQILNYLHTMLHIACPNCHHHKFEIKAVTGNKALDRIEKILVFVGLPARWFSNILMRCKTCKYYWRA